MEKPSTKKPMNVLKTMVFLKNFMTKEQFDNLKEIENFNQLWEIQQKAWDSTITLDLMLIRKFYFLADNCIIIIGPDASPFLEIYKMSHENYFKMTENEKEYIKQYY